MPSELLREASFSLADEEAELTLATEEELGPDWAAHGPCWAWAHDGLRQNGWFRLHGGGRLATRWGMGSWKLVEDPASSAPPLLLLTFSAVEHALRLEAAGLGGGRPAGFTMVSKRRLGSQEGLARQGAASMQQFFSQDYAPCCDTAGWPDAEAAARVAGSL
uniref:Uncharacterized protein n=1 Tax=Alexandrium andersonii TaxID=327968 RepID=A0A7S2N454_9DINO